MASDLTNLERNSSKICASADRADRAVMDACTVGRAFSPGQFTPGKPGKKHPVPSSFLGYAKRLLLLG
jgi:hypothetical protein